MRNAATILGIKRHWRAEYSERRTLGSEGGGGKSTAKATRPPPTLPRGATRGSPYRAMLSGLGVRMAEDDGIGIAAQ